MVFLLVLNVDVLVRAIKVKLSSTLFKLLVENLRVEWFCVSVVYGGL